MGTIDKWTGSRQAQHDAGQGWLVSGSPIFLQPSGIDHGAFVLKNPDLFGMPPEIAESIRNIGEWGEEYREVLEWMITQQGHTRFMQSGSDWVFDVPNTGSKAIKEIQYLLADAHALRGRTYIKDYSTGKEVVVSTMDLAFGSEGRIPRRATLDHEQKKRLLEQKRFISSMHRRINFLRGFDEPYWEGELESKLATWKKLGMKINV